MFKHCNIFPIKKGVNKFKIVLLCFHRKSHILQYRGVRHSVKSRTPWLKSLKSNLKSQNQLHKKLVLKIFKIRSEGDCDCLAWPDRISSQALIDLRL